MEPKSIQAVTPARPAGAAPSDAELVHAVRQGDRRAFVEIVARYQATVCGIALGILGDFAASEDVGQEAFLTAWRRFGDLRQPEQLRPWLTQIARNAALGQLRRRKGDVPLEDDAPFVDGGPSPDAVAANEDEAALVRDALARLPEAYRLPLILFYREGRSVRAVAESLGLSEDAAKQRLARGREMLRDQVSGLIETVLTRTGPTAIFTMAIAVAIGALATPAAIAGTIFAATSIATAATTATATTASTTATATAPVAVSPLLSAMSTSKSVFVAAAFVTGICVPVGYHFAGLDDRRPEPSATGAVGISVPTSAESPTNRPPSFEGSALFAEWRALHDTYGTTPEAMPDLYKAIGELKDDFRRRAFRAALIAEWVQVDPNGGLAHFLASKDASQRRQFFDEWLSRDARAAVDGLLAGGPGWETVARESLLTIAKRVPGRVADIVERLPKVQNNYWDTTIRSAFALVAEGGLEAARTQAQALTGPNRDEALAGVAQAWARNDLTGAIEWARSLKDVGDRDELVRSALMGRASTNPTEALDQVGLVPPGGRDGYFATTTGARVLREAATADFDSTLAWLAAHPGRLGRDDLLGFAAAVTERLNQDPLALLARSSADGSLSAIMPAIDSALLNGAAGQRAAIWEWLRTQPDSPALQPLRELVLRTAAWQDTKFALRIAAELPATPEGERQLESFAGSLLNGGQNVPQIDRYIDGSPDRIRKAVLGAALRQLSPATLGDPQVWVRRVAEFPENSPVREEGIRAIARSWSEQSTQEAADWVKTLPSGSTRSAAFAGVAASWARSDAHGAASWISSLPPGPDRDSSAQSLVFNIADRHPQEAWEWALSIGNPAQSAQAAFHAVQQMASRDAGTARQWIQAGPFEPQVRAALEAMVTEAAKKPRAR